MLTVNGISSDSGDSTKANSTMIPTSSSCTSFNATDLLKIKSSCDKQISILFVKDSHFHTFPHVFEYFENLKSLDISDADIEHIEIPTTFERAVHLTYLDMAGNNLKTLQSYVFTHLNNLSTLDIAHNTINTMEKHAFHGLSNLLQLELSYNNILHLDADIFQPLSRLQTIRLNNNRIQVIDKELFQNNIHLKWAYFASNEIIIVDPNSFTHCHLTSLDLGFNNLTEVDASTSKYLKTLIVANNQLSTLTVPLTVDEVYAANNQISSINSETNELKRLYLSSNCFSNLRNLTNLKKLDFLDLSNNHLRNVQFSDLNGLSQLKELKLTLNKLSEINANDVATNLPRLSVIELSTKHWPDTYIEKLKDELKNRSIDLGQDRADIPDNDAKILTTTPPSRVTTKSTTPTKTSNPTEAPTDNIDRKLEEIQKRLNDLDSKIDSSAKRIDDRLSEMNKTMDAKIMKSSAELNATVSSFKTYETLMIIMFVTGLLAILYQVIIYSRSWYSGTRYRRSQSHDAIFSEQDL